MFLIMDKDIRIKIKKQKMMNLSSFDLIMSHLPPDEMTIEKADN